MERVGIMNRFFQVMVLAGLLVIGTTSCVQNESNTTTQSDIADNQVISTQSGAGATEQQEGVKDNAKEPVMGSVEKIQELISTACDSDAQCKVIGVGDRPCGGFAQFLVYSTTDTDEKELKSQVAIYNKMQTVKNSKSGVVGICQHLSPPKTYCSKKQCVTSQNGRAAEF